MENYINVVLATLAHLGALSKDEYSKLSEKLRNTTLPAGEDAAWRYVETVFKELEIKTLHEKAKDPSK